MKENKYIDLSILLTKDTPVFPGEPNIIFKKHANIKENTYNEHQITINTHFGTHMDFPYHMIDDGKKSSNFKLENFIGKGKVININNPDLNSIEDEDVFLLYSEHIEKGIDNLFNDVPVLDENLVDFLITKKPKMLLLDIPTPDKFPYPIHKKILGNDILIVENVCNMKLLIDKKFKVYAIPLNFEEFDGSPCRVFAEVE
ncbi:MAG: cyclase family protein [Christensenellales bacterium]